MMHFAKRPGIKKPATRAGSKIIERYIKMLEFCSETPQKYDGKRLKHKLQFVSVWSVFVDVADLRVTVTVE